MPGVAVRQQPVSIDQSQILLVWPFYSSCVIMVIQEAGSTFGYDHVAWPSTYNRYKEHAWKNVRKRACSILLIHVGHKGTTVTWEYEIRKQNTRALAIFKQVLGLKVDTKNPTSDIWV